MYLPSHPRTLVITLGWQTAEQAKTALQDIQKVDPLAMFTRRHSAGTMINGEKVSKYMFQFIAAEQDDEKELVFMLKLKYGSFTLHKSPGRAMLEAYGPS